ncbi:MAG TPA: PP2C family protein-serine/threonine phosphatase [Rubrivivax sp.]|nr:PP2C family protein-serine/threonine phosphatase [Rubrivivax sp.]
MTRPPTLDGSATPLMQPPAGSPGPATPLQWLRQQWRLARRPRIESGWASLCGAGHARNQDAVIAAPPLFAVADGVGGGSAGELASSELLAWCRDIPPKVWRRPQALSARLRHADAALAQTLQTLHPGGRSATTFAGAWLGQDGRGCIAHVGDSRILRLQPQPTGEWHCTALTVDHTYANLGEQPPAGGDPDDPARMVGVGAAGEPAVASLRLRENEWLLLCSDGLHRFVPMPLLARLCQRGAGSSSLQALAQELARCALARGSHDDISVLLVRRNPLGGARKPFWLAAAAVAVFAGTALVGTAASRMAADDRDDAARAADNGQPGPASAASLAASGPPTLASAPPATAASGPAAGASAPAPLLPPPPTGSTQSAPPPPRR